MATRLNGWGTERIASFLARPNYCAERLLLVLIPADIHRRLGDRKDGQAIDAKSF